MAIDTKLPIIHNQKQCLRETRRDAPELQCQLPTQPARSLSYTKEANIAHIRVFYAKNHNLIQVKVSPELFETDNEKSTVIETAWQESVHIIDNECYIKGKLKTAII